jgi:hypothetical protein
MDRMEILRLALAASKDARDGLALAREMAAFVANAPLNVAPQARSALALAADAATAPKPAPAGVTVLARPPILPHPLKAKPARAKRAWSQQDKDRAAAMLDAGASYAETGKIIGRSPAAVMKMRSAEALPVKTHQMNENKRLLGSLGVLARGFKLREGR